MNNDKNVVKDNVAYRLHKAFLNTVLYLVIMAILAVLFFGTYDLMSAYMGRTFATVILGSFFVVIVFLDRLRKGY